MKNITTKTNYRFDIPDNQLTRTFQWQVQSLTMPGVSIEGAPIVRSPKLANVQVPGTGTDFEDMQVMFVLDENLDAYAELFKWMLTMQNPHGATTASESNVARTALLHVRDNTDTKTVATFRIFGMWPKQLGEIEWNYTENGDLESVTCLVTFNVEWFEMEHNGSVINPRAQ